DLGVGGAGAVLLLREGCATGQQEGCAAERGGQSNHELHECSEGRKGIVRFIIDSGPPPTLVGMDEIGRVANGWLTPARDRRIRRCAPLRGNRIVRAPTNDGPKE